MKLFSPLLIFLMIFLFSGNSFAFDEYRLLKYLYSNRFTMDNNSIPMVKIGIETGLKKVEVTAPKGLIVWPNGKSGLKIEGSRTYKITIGKTKKAKINFWVTLKSIDSHNRKKIVRARKEFRKMRIKLRQQGFIIAMNGKMLDTRRTLFSLGPYKKYKKARAVLKKIKRKYVGAFLTSTMVSLPKGNLLAYSENRNLITGTSALLFSACDKKGVTVKFKNKVYSFPGNIYVSLDKSGKLSVINELSIDKYLAGILPSELFPSAPLEALKAQAVAARGQVLSKIGRRHTTDPFHLCSKVHCQVYSGLKKRYKSTNKAVALSRGQVLFDNEGFPADTVYHSSSGGFGENNENVWGGDPKPYLRGRPDGIKWKYRGMKSLKKFLLSSPNAFCKKGNRLFRWKKSFSKKEIIIILKKHHLKGKFKKISVLKRGVSGRVLSIKLITSRDKLVIDGELKIRRFFNGLKSTFFFIRSQYPILKFIGGGYGHGVGMSQWGAINRAKRGQSYKKILFHYYHGTSLKTIY